MKVVKNLISIIMSILIIAGLFTIVPFTAGAETFTSGEYDYELLDDNTAKITRYFGDGGKVEIPSVLDGHTVTAISGYNKYDDEDAYKGAFDDCYFLTSVTIPDSVESIGDYAFAWCEKLENVTFGKNLKKIGESAFYYCGALNEITFSDSLTSIDDYAFYSCKNLAEINVPDSVTSIGGGAFYSCKNLAEINVPDSVTSIGGGAFGDTAFSNNKLNFEDDVLYIGKHLIEADKSISGEYKIKDGTLTIAAKAFSDCNGLKSITIPEGITRIDKNVFQSCRRLSKVIIPDGIISIGTRAFEFCQQLLSVRIPDSVTKIDAYAFSDCQQLESVTIGNGVKSIGEKAFAECRNITTLKTSAKSIGNFAFQNCEKIKTVFLGNGAETIDNYAFAGCKSLKAVFVPKSIKEIAKKSFGYYYEDGFGEDSEATVKKQNKNIIIVYEKWIKDLNNYNAAPKDITIKKYDTNMEINPFPYFGFVSYLTNFKSDNKKTAKIRKDGYFYILDKGTIKLSATLYGVKITRTLKPKYPLRYWVRLVKKKITVKKGKKDYYVNIVGRLSFIKPKLLSYNKKIVKVSFERYRYKNKIHIDYGNLEIKGLKKGKTTLKVRVNGVKTLKLKIKVK